MASFLHGLHPCDLIVFVFEKIINDLAGYECPSTRNSIKINILWDKPVVVSSNMGLCSCRSDMRVYTNELLKQGNEMYSQFFLLLFYAWIYSSFVWKF